ncbi:MAG: hypothetical protein L0J35_03135, partial [Tetragenococcus halophilus]|nr:hypothetical protein [Tetragenococcus halophilus]
HHKVIKQTIVVGDPKRETRYKKAQSGAVSAINDLMAGRTKIKESVLPAAIKESTKMLIDTASELSFSEQGIMAVDTDNPNYVTLLNSSGLGVSKDGGQTFHNAITRGQINADLITTGSLNADLITTGSLNADLITTGSLKADRIRGGTFYGGDMTLENSLIINNVNKGIRGNFIYTDTPDSYIPRKYTGEYRINNQALWFKGDIWRDTGQFLGFNTTFFAHDSVKFRRYENEDAYEDNKPSTATLDLTHQHLRLKRDGYPELKLENTGIATIPQIVGMYEIMNRERNFGINVSHSNGGADLEVGVDQQGGFVKSKATYWRTTSGNANVFIGESGALYRSSSAMKYKTDIKREAPTNYKTILNLPSANWIDKEEKEYGIVKQRYYGHIAEDLIEVGLPEFVEYGKDQEVESIMYERLISPLLEVVKDHEKQIKKLEAIINEQ